MVLLLYGSLKHGARIRIKSGNSNLLKAFGYIEKSSNPILLYVCATCSELLSYKSTMLKDSIEKNLVHLQINVYIF